MYYNRKEFKDWQSCRSAVTIADRSIIYSTGIGIVELELLLPDGLSNLVAISNILYIPDLSCSLYLIS